MSSDSAMAGSLKMRGSFAKGPQHLSALERVREWTRERFTLSEEDAILVSEVACAVPGCPPLETVVAFWSDEKTRHKFKLFKPVAEVVEEDLPPAWLKSSLVEHDDDVNCDCC